MGKIDIIIPAYNAEKTIERLLYSIAIQKNISDYNVYIVNDCSEHNYQKYINYFCKYFSVKELNLQQNMGPGYARQYGIEQSKNDYIVFMDSDDYFYSPDSLYKLYNTISTTKSDVAISNFVCELSDKNIVKKEDLTWLHGKIYSREFLEINNIKFNNTRANEDNGFNCLVRFHNPKMYFFDEITYVYSRNSNSLTRKYDNDYNYKCLEQFAYNVEWAINIAIEKKLDLKAPIFAGFNALVDMWCHYVLNSQRDDSINIFKWSVGLKDIFNKYKDEYLSDIALEDEIENIKKFVMPESYNTEGYITFSEFLEKIEVLKNDRYNNSSI